MAQSTFRLATLLKLREATRDERRSALAEALRALGLLDQRIAGVQHELDQVKQVYQTVARPGAVEVDRLLEAQRYEIVMQAELQRLRQQYETIQAEADRRREALVDADRDVKMLEKLRERQTARQVYEADRRERQRLDEIAARRFAEEVA